ncbi:hypothetical protein [Mucilaginibacter defluvii]|uniref:Uncharacterized protein n=1 Tax=Mucilaginibacter defluvii TaxID=1196019 RepID=A0ABP9FP24_9SPHI
MNNLFQRSYRQDLYRFLHTRLTPSPDDLTRCELCLQVYLTIVRELAVGLETWVLLPYSPYLAEVLGPVTMIAYRYQVTFNDTDGLGLDDGFLSTDRPAEQRTSANRMLFPLKDVLTLRSLPEDDLGDLTTEVSVFLLQKERSAGLREAMRTGKTPDLPALLDGPELFVHITCAKSSAYFDAMLIYGRTDIGETLNAAVRKHELETYL